MPSNQTNEILMELFTTEKDFIKNIEEFLIVIDGLKKQTKLPTEFTLKLYLDTISRFYSQLVELLKLTCLFELSNNILESNLSNTDTIIAALSQGLFEQKQMEYILFTLSTVANNETFFTGQFLNLSKTIQLLYQNNFCQNETEISKIINSTNQGNIIQYFASCLAAPIQRLTKYQLIFKQLESEKTDEYPQNSSFHKQDTTSSPHHQAGTPTKKRARHSLVQALSAYIQVSTQAVNRILPAQHEKTAPHTPSKERIPTMNLGNIKQVLQQNVSENNATDLIYNKLQTFKLENEKNENNGIQLITHILQILTAWRQRESKWLPQTERLYYQLYEIYFRLRTCDHAIIFDLIKAYIDEVKSLKQKPQNLNELNELLSNKQPSNDKNLNITDAHQLIRQPVLNRVLKAMQSFQQYSSGNGLTYPSDLEVKIFNAIHSDLHTLNKQLGGYTVESENFWIDVIKIFQRHTHVAGEFPRYFYHSKFGDMLRQVAFQLDQFKPAECRHAFELITAPEGYHYTDFNKKSGHIMSIAKEYRTSNRLCLNVQRIMDFYCNTGLGKLVAEDVQSQKLNLKQGWSKLITRLDENITQLYLNQADNSEQEILAKMIAEIKDIASIIRSHHWQGGKRSRLAGSLESLVALFEGETLSPANYEKINHLPAGIITSTQNLNSAMVENYLMRHITQRACNPFINYYQDTSHRFFRRAAPAKLRHTDVVTEQLNQLYQNPLYASKTTTGNIHQPATSEQQNLQLFKDNIKYFAHNQLLTGPVNLHSAHGNSVAASSKYLKRIGIA